MDSKGWLETAAPILTVFGWVTVIATFIVCAVALGDLPESGPERVRAIGSVIGYGLAGALSWLVLLSFSAACRMLVSIHTAVQDAASTANLRPRTAWEAGAKQPCGPRLP